MLVVGEDPEKQLAPYHEFECTGRDDEFVQDIDITKATRKEYDEDKVDRLRDPEGFLHEPYDKKFYRDPTPEEKKKIGPIGGSGCGNGIRFDSRDWDDGKGYRAKVQFTPKGFRKVTVKRSKVESFREFVEDYHGKPVVPFGEKPDLEGVGDGKGENHGKHKYGYALLNKEGEVIKIIDRTNPGHKWDWYQLGGRWTGMFRLKDGDSMGDQFTDEAAGLIALKYGTTREHVNKTAEAIRSGDEEARHKLSMTPPVIAGGYYMEKTIRELLTKQYSNATCGSQGLGTPPADEDCVDQARKGDIDFQAMRDHDADEAGERYDRVARLLGGSIPVITKKWEDLTDLEGKKKKQDYDKIRKEYHGQPALQVVEAARRKLNGKKKYDELSSEEKKDRDLLGWMDLDKYQGGRAAFVGRAIRDAVVTFAVVKDGKWYERGEMGWFGCVADEKDKGKWADEMYKLIQSVPDDTLLSMYDCHT